MKFPLLQLFLIFLVLLFGGFKEPEKRSFVLPLELLKYECYLIDTVAFDTLYIDEINKKRHQKNLKPFSICSGKPLTTKQCMDDVINNTEFFFIVSRAQLSTLLWKVHWSLLDTISLNDPSKQSWAFYEQLMLQLEGSMPRNRIDMERTDKWTIIKNAKFYKLLIRGSLLRMENSNYIININEYYGNIYFNVLCPI